VLELSHYFVDEEDRGPCGEHAHGNVVESESCCPIFTDLDAVSFAVDGLNLLFFWKRRRSVLPFEQFGLEDILSLIGY
jgi:hypothetical protein